MKTEKPLLRGHFHQTMFFVSLGACALLVSKSQTKEQLVAMLIYSLGLLILFGVSALYHRVHWQPKPRLLMKKLDHCAIYTMIAGTFTPICMLSLPEASGTKLLILIWAVAILGILQSIFFVNLPKLLSAALYLIAGYLILPYLPELMLSLGKANVALVITGGVVYSLGALSYGIKRPVLNPRIFGYHEVFHLMVSIAAIIHFIVIDSILN